MVGGVADSVSATDGGGGTSAASSGRLTLVIASPTPLLNSGLRAALADEFDVVAECLDDSAALSVLRERRPLLTLVHLELPNDAIALVQQATDEALTATVVLSPTSMPDQRLFLQSLRAGAAGVLPVDTDAESLRTALRGVPRGEPALPPQYVGMLLSEFRARPDHVVQVRGGSVRLTPREREVLQHVRAGRSTAVIGQRLGVSDATVRSHILTLRRKLRVPQRRDLRSLPL